MEPEAKDASAILTWLTNRIGQELNCPPEEVELEKSLDLIGLDSVTVLWIAGELAEWLEIEITAALVFQSTTLPDLSETIFALHQSSKQPE